MFLFISLFGGLLMIILGILTTMKQKKIKGIKNQYENKKEKVAIILISLELLLVLISIKFILDSQGIEILNTPLN